MAELGHGDRSGEPDGEMHMIRHTSDAETFAIHIAGDRREIGVKGGAHRDIEHRSAVFRAKDDVCQEIRERLWHGAARWVGLSALMRFRGHVQGRCPRLV